MPSLLLILCLSTAVPDTLPQSPMLNLLPSAVNHWIRSDSPIVYTGREIFKYMDGAGEIYLSYDFRSLCVQRYARPGQEEILVEIFDMGESRNAFGVFTYMRGRGPAVSIGQEGEYKSGLLCFWRARYFVCVQISRENAEADSAVLELGGAIAAAIGVDGELPRILDVLPEEECLPGVTRYFTRHEILNIHCYVADGNPFRLDGTTECVLARMKQDRAYLLIIRYPEETLADSALKEFVTVNKSGASGEKLLRTENGKWTSWERHGLFVFVVFDAATQMQAAEHLRLVKGRLP